MSAWLFMFAASRTSDYQFVMQPEVFDTESCDVLRSQLQLDDSDPARLRTVTVASTSLPAAIIKSANSSITTIIFGNFETFSSSLYS